MTQISLIRKAVCISQCWEIAPHVLLSVSKYRGQSKRKSLVQREKQSVTLTQLSPDTAEPIVFTVWSWKWNDTLTWLSTERLPAAMLYYKYYFKISHDCSFTWGNRRDSLMEMLLWLRLCSFPFLLCSEQSYLIFVRPVFSSNKISLV